MKRYLHALTALMFCISSACWSAWSPEQVMAPAAVRMSARSLLTITLEENGHKEQLEARLASQGLITQKGEDQIEISHTTWLTYPEGSAVLPEEKQTICLSSLEKALRGEEEDDSSYSSEDSDEDAEEEMDDVVESWNELFACVDPRVPWDQLVALQAYAAQHGVALGGELDPLDMVHLLGVASVEGNVDGDQISFDVTHSGERSMSLDEECLYEASDWPKKLYEFLRKEGETLVWSYNLKGSWKGSSKSVISEMTSNYRLKSIIKILDKEGNLLRKMTLSLKRLSRPE